MKISKYILAVILSLFVGGAICQEYGNEWIDFSQRYFKLKLAQNGLYRITAAQLQAAGVPVSSILPSRIQIFRRGQEVGVRRVLTGGGGLDYIEFYGTKNDGTSDQELYQETGAQPHSYYNLFTDTASYFLTWKQFTGSGKTFTTSSLGDPSGLTLEAYHLEEMLTVLSNVYSAGMQFGPESALISGEYDYGEGWTGSFFTKGSAGQSVSFTLNNADQSGPAPVLEMVLIGGNSLEHNIQISAGPDATTQRVIGNASFTSRFSFTFTGSLQWSDIGPAGQCVIRAVALGVASQADRASVASVKLTYPQEFDLGGSENKLYYLPSSTADRLYVSIPTSNASGTRIFDITDPLSPRIIPGTSFSDRLEVVIPDPETERRVLAVTSPLTVPAISEVSMEEIDPAGVSYLILTHQAMHLQASDGLDPVAAYAGYRESAAGGSFNVLVADINEIYDQFNYGDPSPLAIRRFLSLSVAVATPRYIFIIGKGLSPDLGYYRKDPAITTLTNFIPSFGHPGSDQLYTVNIQGGNTVPAIPIGRLNAFTSEHVRIYLDKIREMEALPYDQLWRKNQVLLSGGATASEQNLFSSYVEDFRALAAGNYWGGVSSIKRKSTSEATETINIVKEINAGVSLVTFFGHSGSQITDIEIGNISEYNNPSRYPIFVINGCNAGEIYNQTNTFGETWMIAEDKGAVGFIAHSDLALSHNLRRFTRLFYEIAFTREETFGMSVGDILKQLAAEFFNDYGTTDINKTQIHLMSYQGDPRLTVFGAPSPDFIITGDDISAEPVNGARILASQNEFILKVIVRNTGKTVTDSLGVAVSRTLPDGEIITYHQFFESPLNIDTLDLLITNEPDQKVDGNNTFSVTIDAGDSVTELNEMNNLATFNLFIPKGNTINLYPTDMGIMDSTSVRFVWQSSDPTSISRSYTLEIDTVPSYTSLFRQEVVITGQLLLNYDIALGPIQDSTTFYWRTRFADPLPTEDTTWVESSFSFVDGISAGWGQLDGYQLETSKTTGVDFDPVGKAWSFLETSTPVKIVTHGIDHPDTYADLQVLIDDLNYLQTENTIDPTCRVNTLNAVFFDKESALPIRPLGFAGGDVLNPQVCGRLPQMIHNMTETDILGADRYLETLLDTLETGDVAVLFSFDSIAYSSWDAGVIAALNSIGIQSSTIAGLQNGQPVIFLGQKGFSPGEAIEVVSDGTIAPPQEQKIELEAAARGTASSGTIESSRIGPARTWYDLHYTVEAELSDAYEVEVIGINQNGQESALFPGARSTQLDISSVSASTYPFLKLRVNFSDETNLTPPQLKNWIIDYELPPEGLLVSRDQTAGELQEGEMISRSYDFINISNQDFTDSIRADFTLVHLTSGEVFSNSVNFAAPLAGDTSTVTAEFNSRGKTGANSLAARIIPVDNELTEINNFLNTNPAVHVNADETNPVLDVTFDGGYILDGDIVSPSPVIRVRLRDENQFLLKEDTSGIQVSLKLPCDGCQFERVNFSDPAMTFTPASSEQDLEVLYQPGPLEDGVYGLRISATDESGNSSGDNDYEITFEVINESSITHFYPYPNPFSTRTRFVFTLTGSQVPEEMKIQIMTISGRVVREIRQDELGPVRIGNNITDFAWDGRDEYGDLLANGVYLYKVFIRQNGESIKHRNTAADKAFKNGFGKIYILR